MACYFESMNRLSRRCVLRTFGGILYAAYVSRYIDNLVSSTFHLVKSIEENENHGSRIYEKLIVINGEFVKETMD